MAKDTQTVNRFMIHYSDEHKPLKIEVSFRNRDIDKSTTTNINGIRVYKLDTLCQQKALAYEGRDKIRDLYDLCFITNNYFDELSATTINGLSDAVSHKGIEQFDYLVKTQADPLIDTNKLANDFLTMMDKLGIMTSDEEENIMKDYNNRTIEISLPKSLYHETESIYKDGTVFYIMNIPKGTTLDGTDIGGAAITPKSVTEKDDTVTAIYTFNSGEDPLIKLSYNDGTYEMVNGNELKDAIEVQKENLREQEKEKERQKEVSKNRQLKRDADNDEEL